MALAFQHPVIIPVHDIRIFAFHKPARKLVFLIGNAFAADKQIVAFFVDRPFTEYESLKIIYVFKRSALPLGQPVPPYILV